MSDLCEGVDVWSEGGVWSERGMRPPEMVTAAVGTHPTRRYPSFIKGPFT